MLFKIISQHKTLTERVREENFSAVYQNLNHHHTAANKLPNLCENHPLVVPNKTNDQEIERRKKTISQQNIFLFK